MWSFGCGASGMFTEDQVDRMEAALATIRSALLGSQGDVPPVDAPEGDLWSRDGVNDVGNQPDNEQDPLWASDDIWVRNQNDGVQNQQHENPIYRTDDQGHVIPVYVYVRVRNRSCKGTPIQAVTLQWAKASPSLGWPAPWDGNDKLDNGAALGGTLPETPTTGKVPPGGSIIVQFEWQPPNPALYEGIGGDKSHYCLLSTIGTVDLSPQDLNTLVRRAIVISCGSHPREKAAYLSG
jgi:hypothetical protein